MPGGFFFFPDYTGVIGLGEEAQVPFSSHDIKVKCCQHGVNIANNVNVDHLAGWCLPGVSFIKLLPVPFSVLYSSERSHYKQFIFKGWEVVLHLLEEGTST